MCGLDRGAKITSTINCVRLRRILLRAVSSFNLKKLESLGEKFFDDRDGEGFAIEHQVLLHVNAQREIL